MGILVFRVVGEVGDWGGVIWVLELLFRGVRGIEGLGVGVWVLGGDSGCV